MKIPVTKIIRILQDNLDYIKDRYHVDTLEIFGSYIRAEENEQSDIDILVTFTQTPSLIKFIELENYISDKIGIKADLVIKDALKTNMRQNILSEAIQI